MKLSSIPVMLSIVSAAIALPALGTYHDESGELIMAIDDNGNPFELTQEGWIPAGNPCPGEGPYSIELVKLEGVDESVYILVFDTEGHLFQFNGTEWNVTLDPVDGSVSPCLALLLKATESDLSVMMIDADGSLSFGITGGDWRILSDRISSFPARDIDFSYDNESQSLFPFILGSDGRVYGYAEDGWESSEFIGLTVELTRFEIEKDRDTGFDLMLAVDESGNIYDNIVSGELALTEHDPCPGEGPWELVLNYVDGSGFDLLCIEASGCLHLADAGSWEKITDSFYSVE